MYGRVHSPCLTQPSVLVGKAVVGEEEFATLLYLALLLEEYPIAEREGESATYAGWQPPS
jgi:hypothetical protein